MIDESSYANEVADGLSLTSSAYAEDVTGEVDLTASAYGEDVATAVNDADDGTLRILQFNIGHFNMGTQPAPTNNNPSSTTVLISDTKNDGYPSSVDRDYEIQLQRWEALVKSVGADIIGIEEYNKFFGWLDGSVVELTDTDIFDGYNISVGRMGQSLFAGGQIQTNGWQWNALASKYAMTGAGDQELGSTGVNIAKCYAHYATITLKGKPVIIASTHLNWAQNADAATSRTAEIQSLISWLNNYPYVILMGDFNTDGIYMDNKTDQDYLDGADDFDPFITAGFTLANHGAWGDIKTCPATGSRPDLGLLSPRSYLDNIIVKGFTMSNVMVLDTGVQVESGTVDIGMLTDHCAVVCELTMIEEGGGQ